MIVPDNSYHHGVIEAPLLPLHTEVMCASGYKNANVWVVYDNRIYNVHHLSKDRFGIRWEVDSHREFEYLNEDEQIAVTHYRSKGLITW